MIKLPTYILGFVSGALAAFLFFATNRIESEGPLKRQVAIVEPVADEPARKETPSQLASDAHAFQALDSTLLQGLRREFPSNFQRVERDLEDEYFRMLIEDLARSEPARAAGLLARFGTKENSELSLTLASIWSESSPEEALRWFRTQTSDLSNEQYQYGLVPILQAMARTSPQKMARDLHQIAEGGNFDLLVPTVAHALSETEPAEAIRWLGSLPADRVSPSTLTDAYVGVMQRYARSDPQAASKIVELLESTELVEQLAPQVAAGLARNDVKIALDWIESLPAGEIHSISLATISTEMLDTDPKGAVDLLLGNLDSRMSGSAAVRAAFEAVVEKDISLLTGRFDEIPASIQGDVAEELAKKWVVSPEAFPEIGSLFERLPPGETRGQLSKALIDHYAPTDPATALYWAQKLDLPTEKSGAFQQIVSHSDPSRLSQIADELLLMNLGPDETASFYKIMSSRLDDVLPVLVFP